VQLPAAEGHKMATLIRSGNDNGPSARQQIVTKSVDRLQKERQSLFRVNPRHERDDATRPGVRGSAREGRSVPFGITEIGTVSFSASRWIAS